MTEQRYGRVGKGKEEAKKTVEREKELHPWK